MPEIKSPPPSLSSAGKTPRRAILGLSILCAVSIATFAAYRLPALDDMSNIATKLMRFIDKWGQPMPVVTPPSVGWGINGVLKADASPVRAVQLTAEFFDQAQTHTIQFDGFDSNTFVGASPVNAPLPEAEILWTVNNVVMRRVVSVIDGMSVTGVAEAVTVNVRDNTEGGNGAEYKIGITIAPGSRSSVQQPPILRVSATEQDGTTVFPQNIALNAGRHADITLPANAGIISSFLTLLVAKTEALEDVSLDFRAQNLVVLRAVDGNSRDCWVPIPQGTNSVRITNNTAAAINASLTFGIDG